MKYIELFSMNQSLQKLSTVEKDIPIRTGLKIVKNIQSIQSLLAPVDKMRNEIIMKYSNGANEIKQSDENYAKCASKINELMEEETEIGLEKISLSDLDGISLPISVISAIYPMIDDEYQHASIEKKSDESEGAIGGK